VIGGSSRYNKHRLVDRVSNPSRSHREDVELCLSNCLLERREDVELCLSNCLLERRDKRQDNPWRGHCRLVCSGSGVHTHCNSIGSNTSQLNRYVRIAHI
jgi:hypothetical protein